MSPSPRIILRAEVWSVEVGKEGQQETEGGTDRCWDNNAHSLVRPSVAV